MAFRFVIARRPEADVAISGRHLQFVQAAVKMVCTDCVCSGAQGAPCSLAIFAAHILRRKAPKFVIARREAPLALPLGELSPKVTERALQALPISTGHCSNDTHLRFVIPRSEATWQSREGICSSYKPPLKWCAPIVSVAALRERHAVWQSLRHTFCGARLPSLSLRGAKRPWLSLWESCHRR